MSEQETSRIIHHPRSSDPEAKKRLEELAGIIPLQGQVPSTNLFEDQSSPKPIQLTEDDKRLLEKAIGANHSNSRGYYLREAGVNVWALFDEAIGKPREVAVHDLSQSWEITEEQATAAWLFCNAFPLRCKVLNTVQTGQWVQLNLPGEENPDKILNLKA